MRFKYYIISLKRNAFSIILFIFTICLICFSNSNLSSAKSGLLLWAKFIVPTLFPFFVATELMQNTSIIKILEKFLTPIMKPLFKVPGISSFALIMGSISGYPVGAKIVTSMRNKNLITKNEGNRLLCFTNNSGPLFIIATVGIGLFGSSATGFLLLSCHLLSAISVAVILRFFSRPTIHQQSNFNSTILNNPLTFGSLGEILSTAILSSINTLFLIGGFVVLFSVIISILVKCGIFLFLEALFTPLFNFLNIDSQFISATFIGLIEVTNGISLVSAINIKNISTNIIFTSFLIGFGGISVALQILSVISKSDLSIKPYICGKLMQATFSAFYTYIALACFPHLNLDLNNTLYISLFPCAVFLACMVVLIKIAKSTIK